MHVAIEMNYILNENRTEAVLTWVSPRTAARWSFEPQVTSSLKFILFYKIDSVKVSSCRTNKESGNEFAFFSSPAEQTIEVS